MNYLNVKFKSIIKTSERAICLEKWCDEGIVWLPIQCIRVNTKYSKGIAYIIPEWLCIEKKLNGKRIELYHHPKKIIPQYNQEPLDELKC